LPDRRGNSQWAVGDLSVIKPAGFLGAKIVARIFLDEASANNIDRTTGFGGDGTGPGAGSDFVHH
jgi:hypothetical protein